MKRAAVLIGVNNTGDLQTLKDAAAGARKMAAWAIEQGMDPVEIFTDEDGKIVEARDIQKAIRAIVRAGTVDQLLIYFAGHGVNIRFGEYWLLSGAPSDTGEAVNVEGSVVLARQCGIPHVVLISDACRTAADGIKAQFVTGSEIFPNDGAADNEVPVDQFFACTLGKPAHEVRDPKVTAKEFSALYTTALLEALSGKHPELLQSEPAQTGEALGYVRPRPLSAHLEKDIARRIKDLQLQTKVIQVPVGRITSDDSKWLARLPLPPALGGGTGGAPPPGRSRSARRGAAPPQSAPPPNLGTLSRSLLHTALRGDDSLLHERLREVSAARVAGADEIAKAVARTSATFGPGHYETQCGFKIRGARVVDIFSPRARTELLSGELVRVNDVDPPAASVLLMFDNGRCALIPAINGFIGALTFDDGELVDVAYEPSDNTWRWNEYQSKAQEVRALRSVASSASQHGVFRLDGADALDVAQHMQYAKGIDPTLAIYAAYAYHQLQRRDLIRDMGAYMKSDVGTQFFDIALLGRALDGRAVPTDGRIVPFVPMLSQGWALLAAHGAKLPPSLTDIHRSLVPSLWTLFDAHGAEKLKKALQKGEGR